MFSDTDTETESEAADAVASYRGCDERAPAAHDDTDEQQCTDSSDSEIDTEQSLAERLGRRQRQKKRRRAPKPPSAVCTLSPVADLGDREEAEAAAEDDGERSQHTEEPAGTAPGQRQQRQGQSAKEEISLLSPSPPELRPGRISDGDGVLDSPAESTQQRTHINSRLQTSSEDEDEAALLDSDSDCVVLMTQNTHR